MVERLKPYQTSKYDFEQPFFFYYSSSFICRYTSLYCAHSYHEGENNSVNNQETINIHTPVITFYVLFSEYLR